jgi:hypothetical protein
MKSTVISRRFSIVVLIAFALAACAILAAGPARADDRPKMRSSHQDWSQHRSRHYDGRRYDHGRHRGHDSRHNGWRHSNGHYYGYGGSSRYYDRHRRAWVTPYSIELRSWPYSLRYDSGYRNYGSYSDRYGRRYDRDRYRDCDDDRRYDGRYERERWDDDWDD